MSESGLVVRVWGISRPSCHRPLGGTSMRRAALLVVVSLASASLTLLASPVSATTPTAAKAPPCAGKTGPAAVKAIKKAWDVILNGTGPATLDQKAAAIQGTSDPAFRQVF